MAWNFRTSDGSDKKVVGEYAQNLTDLDDVVAPAPTVGDLFTHDGSNWSNNVAAIGCIVYASANQAITTGGTGEDISFTTASWDPYSMWSAGDPTKVTISKAGIYMVTANVNFADSASAGYRMVSVRQNSLNYLAVDSRLGTSTSFTNRLSVSTIVNVAASDYLTMRVFQSSGADLDVVATNYYSPYFRVARIGSA